MRNDVAFGLAVGVYQIMWLSLSAEDADKRVVRLEPSEPCVLKPPCFRASLRLYTRLDARFNEPEGADWPQEVRELAASARRTFEQHVARAQAAQAPAPSPTPTPVPAAPFLVHRSRPDLRGLPAARRPMGSLL